jgi:hypothetical protein
VSDEPERGLMPSTSTIGLTFADVERQLPQGVQLKTEDGVTELSVRINGIAPGLGLSASSFVAYGYAYASKLITPSMQHPLLALAALVSAYFFVGFIFGRRRVTVDGDRLRVRSTLPLPGDGTVRLEHIDQLNVVRVGKRSGSESWRIDALHRGKVRHVMHDLKTSEQALVLARYLAQEHRLPAPRVIETP